MTIFFITKTVKSSSEHSKPQTCVSTANALRAYTQAHLMYKAFMINCS